MRVIAQKFIGYADLDAPMSSPGYVLVETAVPAYDRDEAIAACRARGMIYVMPLVEIAERDLHREERIRRAVTLCRAARKCKTSPPAAARRRMREAAE